MDSFKADNIFLMSERLTRDRIVDAAEAIVESEGLTGLSMRALCEKLDVSVTSIYWHVGNKDALLDALVERTTATIVERKPRGATPQQRIRSIARSVVGALEAHGELIGIAHTRGAVSAVFAPARRSLAVEFSAAGLRGERLADATNAVLQYVVAYSITESVVSRSPAQEHDPSGFWDGQPPVDPVAAEKLRQRPDRQRSFDVGLDALIAGLLAATGSLPSP